MHPALRPSSHVVSEYANASGAWVITIGFLSWALSLVVTSASCSLGRVARMGTALAAAGALLVAGFHTQAVAGARPDNVAATASGRLHDVGGELIIGGLALSALATLVGRDQPRALRVGAGALLAGASVISAVLLTLGDPAPGLRQRALLACALAWQALLLAASGRAQPEAIA